jgi:thiol:disulfide interchange protein DsbD
MESFLNNPEQYLQGSAVLAVIAVYLGGVLISFTPCVYPVAPIIIAYIGSRGATSRGRSVLLSVVYVLGMALTYTILGAVSALTGQLFGQIQSSPWTHLVVANVCIIFGLAMLDAIAIPMPAFLAGLGAPRKGMHGIPGSFILGAASGLIMGPCTAPVLGVLLAFVAARQSVVYGMVLLFSFSVGMGTLLVILGTFSGALASLPRAGAWMVYVKKAFGIIMLGLAEYFLITAGQYWI